MSFLKKWQKCDFYLIRCTKAVFLCSPADQGWLAATKKWAKHTQHIPRSVLSHFLWPHQPWERRRSARARLIVVQLARNRVILSKSLIVSGVKMKMLASVISPPNPLPGNTQRFGAFHVLSEKMAKMWFLLNKMHESGFLMQPSRPGLTCSHEKMG